MNWTAWCRRRYQLHSPGPIAPGGADSLQWGGSVIPSLPGYINDTGELNYGFIEEGINKCVKGGKPHRTCHPQYHHYAKRILWVTVLLYRTHHGSFNHSQNSPIVAQVIKLPLASTPLLPSCNNHCNHGSQNATCHLRPTSTCGGTYGGRLCDEGFHLAGVRKGEISTRQQVNWSPPSCLERKHPGIKGERRVDPQKDLQVPGILRLTATSNCKFTTSSLAIKVNNDLYRIGEAEKPGPQHEEEGGFILDILNVTNLRLTF